MKRKKSKIFSITFIIIMALLVYAPTLLLVVYSFTDADIGKWNGFSLELYQKMFADEEIITALVNTLIVAVISSIFACLLGVITSIGIYSMKKTGKKLMNGLTQITMVNADIVTAVAFMMFFIMVEIIPDGYATLIIAHTTICTPYVIMSVLPKLSELDPNVYEAGLDLGANPHKTLWKVMIPQLLPAVILGFALSFVISLDDFTISTFVSSSVDTIPKYIYTKLKRVGIPVEVRALSAIILVFAFITLLLINIFQNKKKKNKNNI